MNPPITENGLCEILQTQINAYDAARLQLVTIQGRLSTDGWSVEAQQELGALVENLRDEKCRDHIQRWKQQNQQASGRLRTLLDGVKQSLQDVLQQVYTVEETARKLRDDLMPRMDLAARERQALSAYGRSARIDTEPSGS